jgi:hypothetical protein
MCLYITFTAGLNSIIIQARLNLLSSRQHSYTLGTIGQDLRRRTGRSVPGMYCTVRTTVIKLAKYHLYASDHELDAKANLRGIEQWSWCIT